LAKTDIAAPLPTGWLAGLAIVSPPDPDSMSVNDMPDSPRAESAIGLRPYAEFMDRVVRNTKAVLAPNGVIVIVTKGAVAGVGKNASVDLEFEAARALHETPGLEFVTRAVIRVTNGASSGAGKTGRDAYTRHVLVFRRNS
jgi:hypothetical protein